MDLFREKDYEVVQVDLSTPAAQAVSMATKKPEDGTIGCAVVIATENSTSEIPITA